MARVVPMRPRRGAVAGLALDSEEIDARGYRESHRPAAAERRSPPMHALLLQALRRPADQAPKAESVFAKVGPNARVPGRTKDETRAVVLIHGLSLHVLTPEKLGKPELRVWQKSDSILVKELSRHADV